jgi:hypothetical protein
MNRTPPPSLTALQAKEQALWLAFAPFAFQAARVLRDSGILAAIEAARPNGLTLEAIAEKVKLPVYGTRVLLEAGLGIELVHEDDARRYTLTKTAHYLLHDPVTASILNFSQDVSYLGLHKLEESVREQRPAGLATHGSWPTIYEALAHLPEKVRKSWFDFDHAFSDSAFPHALPLVFRHKPARLLDIGGNTGKWAEQCARHDPAVEITIADLPGQLRTAQERLGSLGLLDRVKFHETNLLDASCAIPRGFDAVWMSQFLDCFSEAQIVSILRRCAAALEGDARLFILEPFWDRQRFAASAFCLQMTSLYFTALANGNSQMYRSDVFLRCVADAGLDVIEQHDHLGLSHTLLVCRARR